MQKTTLSNDVPRITQQKFTVSKYWCKPYTLFSHVFTLVATASLNVHMRA